MASSSSATPASARASSSANGSKYDVFLSFRGEDTRNSFTDHLYEALKNAGIHTFRDNDEIRRGEELKPEIESAIEASLASVIVLSKNYATSTWCLEELRLILKQRRDCNQFVLPVFYDADPSDVKKQNKTFMIQVKTSSMWTDYNVSRWKAALTEVANLAGLVLLGSETKFIKKIVDTVYNSICHQQVSLPPNLIGMDTRDIEINSWLKHSDAQFLAICGMGGSGKTTLALYIVSLNWNSFENVSIIENIGSIWKEPHDLLQLQEKLFGDISGGKKRIIPSVSQGKFTIEKALQEKRALIVLDDIVETRQLVALLGTGIINKQSKIIITTRENNIGKWFESTSWRCREYQMELLDDGKSLELLSLHAFKSRIPMEGYEELAKQAVLYCEGNPLALEVLGSSLFDCAGDFSEKSNIPVWESTLRLLKRDIHKGIQRVLIRSYDSLPNIPTKQLFLHIACFFMGKDVDYVTKILERDYFALSGIKTLTNRCLITISPNKKLMMHQLLQEMGRNIVDQESSTLTKRSRIWRYKESCHVLKSSKGSKRMEGLALDMSMPSEDNYAHKSGLKTDSLRKMNNLKLLQLNFVELTGSYENLSEDLRWLCWHGFQLRTLPFEFFIGNLVALDMSYSCLEVFEPPMILQSLKILNLKGSQYLLEIRFISRLPNLETLVLWGCGSLVRVCETLGDLTSLDLLNMTGCESLCKWNKMNTLVGPSESDSFGGVKEHTTFSLPRSLQRFYLNKCNLECTDSFPLSFSMQPFLKYLNLGNSLFEVLPYYDHLQNLRVLDLSFCPKLKWLLCLPNTLAELYIYYCISLEKITFQSPRFTLQEFGYRGCTNLCEIEGFIKLIPIAKLDETAMGHMKWLKEYQHLEVCLVGDDELTEDRSMLVQMLFEFDLMSISLPEIKDPNMSPDYKSESPSLSFDVPSCPKASTHRRLKGLNIYFKYTISGDDWAWFAKITTTNGVDIMYNPKVFGRPEFGEFAIWLSYLPIGNMLDIGDKVNVSIAVMYGLVIHECGVSLVYSDDEVADENMKNNMEWEETIGGDLSGFQLSTKTYYLCRRDFYELMEVGRLNPGWLSMLVGVNIDDTEVRGWRKTGRPKQLNPSFTELKTVRCIINGPGPEEVYKIAERSKPSEFGHVARKAVDIRETSVINETMESTPASLEKKKEPVTKGLLETITVGNDVSHAIGIDLGTTYSCVGVWKLDRVEIIPNIQCYRTTPSCVALSGAARLIGVKAKNRFTVNPTNTVYDVKRLIGRRFSDAKVQEDMKLWPFKVITGPNDIPKVVVSYKGEEKAFFAEEISSMVLMKLKEDAELYLGETVKDAVITVPVYFDDSQRQATMDACDVAGFKVLQIISDSTAAAISYGSDMGTNITRETTVLIFDLGGGTFDVSLVTIDENSKLEVKAVAGDTHLGGQDFDNILLDHVVMEFNKKVKTDISGNLKALARLRVACEKAKRVLSSTTQTSIELNCLHEGVDFYTKITRKQFENLNAENFSKCVEIVDRCLTDAKMNKKDVDEVILVGGSTRIPKVQQLLQDFFNGKELCKTINVEETVAYGAAVLAAKLSGKTSQKVKDLLLLDIVPLSLGTNMSDGTLDVIIPRYTPIPAKNERTYYTTEDNQSNIAVDIYQGERIIAKDNNWLGKFTIEVPPAPKGISKVNVVFNIDANGILNCLGEEVTGGRNKKIMISVNKQRLSMEEIKKMKKDAEKYKFDDDEHMKLFAISALKDYTSDVQNRIKILGNSYEKTMNKNDMKKIEIALQDAREYLDGRKLADVYTVKKTLNQLKKICDPIMQTGPAQDFVWPKANF